MRITWFFGLFLDDNLFVVHMISHMVTLSLPFCLLYLCSVFKVQSWISDVRYWILNLIPIPFLKTIVPGVPLPVFKRLPSRITCRFNLPGGLYFESHSALRLMCFSPFRPPSFHLDFFRAFHSLFPESFLPELFAGLPAGGLYFESHSALWLMCFSPFRPAAFAAWWAQVDSNHRPHAYQACALTT